MSVGAAIKISPQERHEPGGDQRTASGLEQVLLQLAESRSRTDSRFETAIAELRGRLQSSSGDENPSLPSHGSDPPPHIESLQERIADLAERVRQADREQAPDSPGSAAVTSLDEQLNALNAALEVSLNAPEHEAGSAESTPAPIPASPPEDINAAGAASARTELRTIAERLGAIEEALNFTGAQSERIGAIEGRLMELMTAIEASDVQAKQTAEETARQLGSQIDGIRLAPEEIGSLDAVQQELQGLARRASSMDERTLTTLEAISSTLQGLMERSHAGEADAPTLAEETPPAQAASQQPATALDDDDGWNIDTDTAAPGEQTDCSGEDDETNNQEMPRAKPQPMAPGRLASEVRKPRRFLVIAAVMLLVASAGLLYGRLKTHGPGAADTGRHLAPVSPAPADRPGGSKRQVSPPKSSEKGEATAGNVGQTVEPRDQMSAGQLVRFQGLA